MPYSKFKKALKNKLAMTIEAIHNKKLSKKLLNYNGNCK